MNLSLSPDKDPEENDFEAEEGEEELSEEEEGRKWKYIFGVMSITLSTANKQFGNWEIGLSWRKIFI